MPTEGLSDHFGGDAMAVEECRSMLSARSVNPEPQTTTKLVNRIRLMANRLLPVQVELDTITAATSSIITPAVIRAFAKAGGDFGEAVPWCLLKARGLFREDAARNPTDYDENLCRATACEVLARRIVHDLNMDRLESVMSTRFRYRESDGDISPPSNVIELAIDQHAIIFLSSSEAQHVVQHLWRGDWVQVYTEGDMVDWRPYDRKSSPSFWDHLNPHRLGVPRYQSTFDIVIWIFFLFVYSQAVQTPIEKQHAGRLDGWEIVLYTMGGGFLLDTLTRTYKEMRLTSHPLAVFGFWTIVDFLFEYILAAAFTLRVIAMYYSSDDVATNLHLKSFQVLSCAAPLIWMKLLTVFNGTKVIGSLQVVVFRMLRDSLLFAILLIILAAGFAQALFALDAADGEVQDPGLIANALLQALLGSPDFETPNNRFGWPFGLILYYGWSILTIIVLLNVLIALFGTSYSNVEENATDEFLAFFAYKTVKLIRSPDTYVYIPPFNLIEIFLLVPLEFLVPPEWYHRVNMVVMSVLFFIPLCVIAVFESQMNVKSNERFKRWFEDLDADEEDADAFDPSTGEDDSHLQISKVPFDELCKAFPNAGLSPSAAATQQIEELGKRLDRMEQLIKGQKRY